jgi:hypothetical protein
MAKTNKQPNTSLTPPGSIGPNVAFVRSEVIDLKVKYDVISDCVEGSFAVKRKTDKYLPMPNAADKSDENKARYDAYLARAVFYNVTRRTLSGLLGQIFLRKPVVELPPIMEVLKNDLSGSGITLEQTCAMCCGEDIAYGRLGLLTDYPDRTAPATAADLQSGKVRPSVLVYSSEHVINWRRYVKDGRELFSLVVIYENVIQEDDGFEQLMVDQWRVLRIINGIYQVDLFQKRDGGFTSIATFYPKDHKGVNLDEIPFTFVGVNNNDATPDDPPMYDIADLNIAHYRNSADYEESCFMVGQPTIALTGLTEAWVKETMKGRVELGSRAAILLPVGGDAKLVQADPNTMPKEGMDHKERQMVALGAKLVQDNAVSRTLGEAELENTAEISVLAGIAKNVEIGMIFALTWCARFMGADEKQIKLTLNTEFDLTQLSSQDQTQITSDWKDGAITFSEMRNAKRRSGVASLNDDEAKKQLKQDEADGVGKPPPPVVNDPTKPAPMVKEKVAPAPTK